MRVCKPLTLQVRVVLGAAQALLGALHGGGLLEESRGVTGRSVRIQDRLLLLLLFSLYALLLCVPFYHRVLFGSQRRLHDDGGPLPQVLPAGRLGRHDGLGAVHPGRRLAAQVAVGLLPAAQLSQVLLLDVFLRHR